MDLYFTKATYTGNMYKISDFYLGNNLKKNPNKMISTNFDPNDGLTYIEVRNELPDGSDIRDYTHVIISPMEKIYNIVSFDYLNGKQWRLTLDEDPFIANYQTLKNEPILLAQTNDVSKFLGYNSVQDLAVRNTTSIAPIINNTNATGTWVLFTFQSDVVNLEFNIGEIANYPTVGTFASIADLNTAFPPVDTSVPSQVPYYLKFAEVTSTDELYQAIYSDEDGQGVSWIRINKNPVIVYKTNNVETGLFNKAKYTYGTKISNIGDITTIQVAFPLDATLIGDKTSTMIYDSYTANVTFSIPTFYNIKSWNNVDKLLSIKIVPQEVLGITEVDRNDQQRITTVDARPSGFIISKTPETYFSKVISNSNLVEEIADEQQYNASQKYMPMCTVKQFKDIFDFDNWSYLIDGPDTYEPFKKYFLYYYGAMVEIPARYVANGFKVRLVVTSTGVLYEVYTDHMNIIGSGRLPWDTTYKVDQLDLFYASNPTYKDQFNINMISNLLKSTAGGLMAGAVAGPGGMVAGASGGIIGGVTDFGLGMWSESLRQKGLRDKADQIFGQNEVALTNLKGFDSYLVIVEPETAAKNQMLNELYMTGWSCSTYSTIHSLPTSSNSVYSNGKIVTGKLLKNIKNNYVTGFINNKLMTGVILID